MSKASDKKRVLTVVTTIVGLGVSFVMVFPIIWLLMSSFKDSTELFAYPLHFLPENFSLDSYKNVIGSGFFQYVKNSLFLAVVGTLITLAISAMCGYGLAIYRHEITYSNKVFAVFLLGTLRSLKLDCRNDNEHNTHNHADCGSVAVAVLGKALVKHVLHNLGGGSSRPAGGDTLYQRVLL